MRSVRDSITAARELADLLAEQAEIQDIVPRHSLRLRLWAEDCYNVADYLERGLEDPEAATWDAGWAAVDTGPEDTVSGVLVTFPDGQRHLIEGIGPTETEGLLLARGFSTRRGQVRVQKASFNRVVARAPRWSDAAGFTAWLDGEPAVAGGRTQPEALCVVGRTDIHSSEWSGEE